MAAVVDTPVTYEDLADIERDFNDVETEIIRHEAILTAPLYARRATFTSSIPNFWPLVLEQAPPDIDQHIQPSDSALLLSSLLSLSVSNFELDLPNGDPRSIAIRFEFTSNEYFEDTVLEKRFWHRRAKDGWAGLVSEPVGIRWKKEKDLTGGLLGLVCKAWEAEKATTRKAEGKTKGKKLSEEQRVLKKNIESTGMGGLSFFAWFGFIGRRVSVEESNAAVEAEKEKREERRKGNKGGGGEKEASLMEGEDEDDEDDLISSLEIFPDGDELAIAISGDLWPNAIKYFTQAQEQDGLSDADFESDDDEGPNEDQVDTDPDSEADSDQPNEQHQQPPPTKKRRAGL